MGLLDTTNDFRQIASASRIEPASGPEPAAQVGTRPPRIAIFTHDTFGLGHVRRCLHILRALSRRSPDAALLLITGSPAVQLFDALPGNADWVKIPTVVKTGSRGHGPPHLPLPRAEVALLRERLIREAVAGFSPDVLLVDNFPLGSQGELLATLKEARRSSVRTVLGLRDILDAPEVVCKEWTRQGIYDVLDRYYDRILVYGMKEVLDAETAYCLPSRIASRVSYCGYVTETAPPPRPAAEVRAGLGFEGPFLLATGGGGGDGYPLLKVLLQALPLVPEVSALIVTGPLMSPSHQSRLRERANGRRGVVIRDYEPELRSVLAAADLVVSMCGYNIAAEIAALRLRAVVVPRTWRYGEHQRRSEADVEWEQMLRAQALARLGMVDLLDPEALAPERLAERIRAALARPAVEARGGMDLGGIESAAGGILALANGERGGLHGGW